MRQFLALLPLALPSLGLSTLSLAQVSLIELPALARARAERLRPQLVQLMEPFWPDLALRYRDSAQFLDGRIAEVVALGDTVVPLLLEQLQPAASNTDTRSLAANCRRILQQLSPASFLDALVELVLADHPVGRPEALRLLGHANSPRALATLEKALADGRPDERQILLEAFGLHRAKGPAQKLVVVLGSTDRPLRRAALEYLIAAAPANVAPTVLQSLSTEEDNGLLPLYVSYFAAATPSNEDAARALLPLLDGGRLDWQDTRRLIQALAKIAPKDHDPTERRLHEILDSGETGALGLEAALTLRELGDKNGIKRLQSTLNDRIRKASRRQEAQLYEQRADLFFAIEEYKLAGDDYERVIDNSTSALLSRKIRKQLARCAARRGRHTDTLRQFQQIEPSYDEVMEMAEEDPAIKDALESDRLKKWLESLPRN